MTAKNSVGVYGICPVCEEKVRVRLDGTFTIHRWKGRLRRFRGQCAGSSCDVFDVAKARAAYDVRVAEENRRVARAAFQVYELRLVELEVVEESVRAARAALEALRWSAPAAVEAL